MKVVDEKTIKSPCRNGIDAIEGNFNKNYAGGFIPSSQPSPRGRRCRCLKCEGFVTSVTAQNIPLKDGKLMLYSGVFDKQESNALLVRLCNEINWRQPQIRVAGNLIRIPRLQAWHGDAIAHYQYSGLALTPEAWTELLLMIKARVEGVTDVAFNSLLLNRYRSGRDSVGWHSDDEPELGVNPAIASVSLGAARYFRLQHKRRTELKMKLELPPGSVLLMGGELQHHWRHQLPKTEKPVGERVNLTFRRIYAVA